MTAIIPRYGWIMLAFAAALLLAAGAIGYFGAEAAEIEPAFRCKYPWAVSKEGECASCQEAKACSWTGPPPTNPAPDCRVEKFSDKSWMMYCDPVADLQRALALCKTKFTEQWVYATSSPQDSYTLPACDVIARKAAPSIARQQQEERERLERERKEDAEFIERIAKDAQ